jgi:CheY-like chemotaxis protein/acyl-CoA thioesterase FadM
MKKKILIIDDDKLVAKSVERLLKVKGYEVTLAHSGSEAIEISSKNSFDLIISDIRMPGMDGIETLKKIKEHQEKSDGPKCEFMAITGYAADDAPAEGAKLGITNFILKPFESTRFLDAVENALNSKTQELAYPVLAENELETSALKFPNKYFSIEKTVFLEQTNIMGNTYFANYVLWQGEARESLLLSHPNVVEEMKKNQHVRMITHSVYHRFIEETTFGDLVEIRVTAREIKHCSFVLVFQVYKKREGSFIGEGWQRITFLDLQKGNFCTIPPFIKELILPIQQEGIK